MKTANISDEFVNLNSKIGNDVRILELFSKNRDKNILKLNEQRKQLYEKLKANREKINRALDAFEIETKLKLQSKLTKNRKSSRNSKIDYRVKFLF